ncbi:MAG: hypothetical protein ACYC9W_10100 [Candidatus Limnocylindria bacterium]
MGTRYEDQPVEQWAGAASLDPTPVWKQYFLVAAFVLVALVLVAVAAYSALAVELATPPASVIGGRVVLSTTDVPVVGAQPRRFGAPLLDAQHAFYLWQPDRGIVVAIKATALDGVDPARSARLLARLEGVDRYLVSVDGAKVVVNTSRVISGTQVVPAPSDPTFR